MFRVSPAIYSTALAAAFVISVSVAAGMATTQVATDMQASVAEARTVEVLRATATRIAEQKQNTLVISTTIQDAPDQIVSNDSAGIPLHEAPTSEVVALNPPVTIYPTPQMTPQYVPPGAATVNADIAIQRSTGTPMATDDTPSTPLAFPIVTETPTPAHTPIGDVMIVTLEMLPTETYAPTLTIEPPPTPAPTDVPKSTQAPLTSTVEPSATPEPIVTPTIEPAVTDSPLVSPLATPTMEATAAP